jgi:hypothetical protein
MKMPSTENETELRRRINGLQQRVAELEKALGEHQQNARKQTAADEWLSPQEA